MSFDNHLPTTNVPLVLYKNRYCNQEGFSVLVCGGMDNNKNNLNQVLEVKIPSFEVIEFPSMEKSHYALHITTINSEIIGIFNNYTEFEKLGSSSTSVEVYSEETKTWKHQYVNLGEPISYCLCSFKSRLYIIGGCVIGEEERLLFLLLTHPPIIYSLLINEQRQ